MGKVQHAMSKLDFTVAAGATVYVPVGMGPILSKTTEARAEVLFRTAVTLSKLWMRVVTNGTTGTSTVRLRKNGANGNMVISINAGAAGEYSDLTNTDALGVGDKACLQITNGGGGSLDISLFTLVIDTGATDSLTKYIGAVGQIGVNSATRQFALCNLTSFQTLVLEAEDQYKFNMAGTLKNLYAYVSANTRTTDTTIGLRRGGTNDATAVTYGAGVTGALEDTTNATSVSANNLTNYRITMGSGSGTDITIELVSIEFITTAVPAQGQIIAKTSVNGSTVSAGETRYSSLFGHAGMTTSEANARSEVQQAFTGWLFRVYVSTNNLSSGNTTFTVRKNGVDTSLSIVVPSGAATGWKEEGATTVDFVAGDEISVSIIGDAGGTGGVTFESLGLSYEQTVGGGGSSPLLLKRLLLG